MTIFITPRPHLPSTWSSISTHLHSYPNIIEDQAAFSVLPKSLSIEQGASNSTQACPGLIQPSQDMASSISSSSGSACSDNIDSILAWPLPDLVDEPVKTAPSHIRQWLRGSKSWLTSGMDDTLPSDVEDITYDQLHTLKGRSFLPSYSDFLGSSRSSSSSSEAEVEPSQDITPPADKMDDFIGAGADHHSSSEEGESLVAETKGLIPWPYDMRGLYEHHPKVPMRIQLARANTRSSVSEKAKQIFGTLGRKNSVKTEDIEERMSNSCIPHPPWGTLPFRSDDDTLSSDEDDGDLDAWLAHVTSRNRTVSHPSTWTTLQDYERLGSKAALRKSSVKRKPPPKITAPQSAWSSETESLHSVSATAKQTRKPIRRARAASSPTATSRSHAYPHRARRPSLPEFTYSRLMSSYSDIIRAQYFPHLSSSGNDDVVDEEDDESSLPSPTDAFL